jgi:hypothetical protein
VEERPFRAALSGPKEKGVSPCGRRRMTRIFESILGLGPFLIPIVAIIVGGAVAITAMVHRHNERLAKIERGIDPDASPRS